MPVQPNSAFVQIGTYETARRTSRPFPERRTRTEWTVELLHGAEERNVPARAAQLYCNGNAYRSTCVLSPSKRFIGPEAYPFPYEKSRFLSKQKKPALPVLLVVSLVEMSLSKGLSV